MSELKKKYKASRPFSLNRYVNIMLFLSFIFLLSSCGGSGGNTAPSNAFLLTGQIDGPAQEGITVQVSEGNTPIKTATTDTNGHYSFTLPPGYIQLSPLWIIMFLALLPKETYILRETLKSILFLPIKNIHYQAQLRETSEQKVYFSRQRVMILQNV